MHGQVHRRYTLYGQNVENQIVGRWDDLPPSLRPHKDEFGRPLGKYTDNSANLIQQGFQRIKDRFKLLHSARKILKGERTASCFYSRVDKNDGVGVLLNKHRNKANYSNVMRCANS